jgi:hypothetical protein
VEQEGIIQLAIKALENNEVPGICRAARILMCLVQHFRIECKDTYLKENSATRTSGYLKPRKIP